MGIGSTRLDDLLSRGKLLKELNMWYEAFDKATQEQVIQWIKDQLFYTGKDGKGVVIGEYSYTTELITFGRKQQGDHYTFFETGYFYSSLQFYISDHLIEINGDGGLRGKAKKNLYRKYGEYITTLDSEGVEKIKEVVRIKFREYLRKILLLN